MPSSFNNFIQRELPKRPFTDSDGSEGQILVRSNDPLKARELVWTDVGTILDTYNKTQIDDSFAAIDHTHSWADIEDKPDFSLDDHNHSWASIEDKPSLFPPELHNHSWADIIDKPDFYTQSEADMLLSDKSDVDHTHIMSDVANLELSLSEKSNIGHIHEISEITNLEGQLNNKSNIDHIHTLAEIESSPTNNIYVDINNTNDYVETGFINAPFKSIQNALTYLGQPTSANDFSRVCVIHITPGIYTENLEVPCRPIMIYGQGVIINGNITQNIANALKFGVGSSVYKPTLSICGHPLMDARTTHRSRVHGIEVTGNIEIQIDANYTGYQGTHHDLVLSAIKLNGYILNAPNTGGCICYFNNFRIGGNITSSEIQLYNLCDGRIDGIVDVSTFLEINNVIFNNNIILNNVELNNKWINCDFSSAQFNSVNSNRILNIDPITSSNITKMTFVGNPVSFNLLNKASGIQNDSLVVGNNVKEALNNLKDSILPINVFIQNEEPTVYDSNTLWIKT